MEGDRVGGLEGDGVGDAGWWAAGGGFYFPLGLCGLAMSPRNASYRPKHT